MPKLPSVFDIMGVADPVLAAMRHDDTALRQMYSQATENDLKKLLMQNGLAERSQLEGLSRESMLELLVSSARAAKEARD